MCTCNPDGMVELNWNKTRGIKEAEKEALVVIVSVMPVIGRWTNTQPTASVYWLNAVGLT